MSKEIERKQKLIEKYKERPVSTYIQVDAWCNVEPGDCYVDPDNDNDWICWGITEECMRTENGIRILISKEIYNKSNGKENLIRLLEKVLKHIKSTDGALEIQQGNYLVQR